jgi:hypothetical protein
MMRVSDDDGFVRPRTGGSRGWKNLVTFENWGRDEGKRDIQELSRLTPVRHARSGDLINHSPVCFCHDKNEQEMAWYGQGGKINHRPVCFFTGLGLD